VVWGLFSKTRSVSRPEPANRQGWPPGLLAALADLERLIASRPELKAPGTVLARVLEVAFARPVAPMFPPILGNSAESATGSIRTSWQEGQPALHGALDFVDGAVLAERTLAICEAVRSGDSPAADRFHAIIKGQPERVVDLIKPALALSDDAFKEAVRAMGPELEPRQVDSVLRLALLPMVADWSRQICAQLTDDAWPHGACPVCGSAPALAEARGLEQRRHLRCDRCAGDWPCRHFLCPFCGTSDHRALHYAYVEAEQDRHRLAICDNCGCRLKIVATISPLSPPGLLVAELASIHLDLLEFPQPSSPGQTWSERNIGINSC
jgi:hypothetical protein